MKTQILDTESYSPLYRQLMQRIRIDISQGKYPVHSRIPSEQELCRTYQVSRVTVRKALAELTQEGLLRPHQGKGTFVGVPRIGKSLRDVNSFHSACRMMGCVPGTKIIRVQTVHAEEEDREKLLSGDQVLEIVRLRMADDVPVMLETNRFAEQYDWLREEDLSGSLYDVLLSRGVEAMQATHEISLIYASAAQARLLEVEPGSALLHLHEVIYDQHGLPLHISRQAIRGDRFTFHI